MRKRAQISGDEEKKVEEQCGRVREKIDGGTVYSAIRGQLQSVSSWDSHLNVHVEYGLWPFLPVQSAWCLSCEGRLCENQTHTHRRTVGVFQMQPLNT